MNTKKSCPCTTEYIHQRQNLPVTGDWHADNLFNITPGAVPEFPRLDRRNGAKQTNADGQNQKTDQEQCKLSHLRPPTEQVCDTAGGRLLWEGCGVGIVVRGWVSVQIQVMEKNTDQMGMA
ncbi:hypothetical protein PSCICN_42100 [Pseudomonas cichorii]|uniref:hypothetical protein n=1 Tax=Pseudomonas cichorii TaxID=36746 RepID=UPI001910C412|nr:hypothetical protein [Pseudomonas cichorii]GFM83518.1 hypothetical protein PSCICN_42100 [Pseudomonas cichorii]